MVAVFKIYIYTFTTWVLCILTIFDHGHMQWKMALSSEWITKMHRAFEKEQVF